MRFIRPYQETFYTNKINMLMILAGAIFACLIGIIYLLWNQRTLQKQVDNLENLIAQNAAASSRSSSGGMPPLEEVIAHYEQQLSQEEHEHEQEGNEILDTIMEEPEVGDDEPLPESDSPESAPQTEPETKMIDLSGESKPEVNMAKFNSIKAKDFKEKCKELGFSPKGPKQELILRLLKHPSFNSEEDLIAAMTKTEGEDNSDAAPVEAEEDVIMMED